MTTTSDINPVPESERQLTSEHGGYLKYESFILEMPPRLGVSCQFMVARTSDGRFIAGFEFDVQLGSMDDEEANGVFIRARWPVTAWGGGDQPQGTKEVAILDKIARVRLYFTTEIANREWNNRTAFTNELREVVGLLDGYRDKIAFPGSAPV